MILVIAVIGAAITAIALLTGGKTASSIIVLDANVLAKEKPRYQERELRVRGFVKAGSVLRYGPKADFVIALEGSEIPVHFNGETQLPDTFSDGAPVRADGRLDGQGRLVSTRVEAKCASKYEAEGKNHPGATPYGKP